MSNLPTNKTDSTTMLGDHAANHNAVNKALNNLQIYNVLDPPYNAVGDGVTIDLAAINSAITDANSAGGGTVFLPATSSLTYLVNGLVILKSNVTLLFGSKAVTIKLANASNTGVISNNNVSTTNAIIIGGTVDGNAANQTSNGSVGAAAIYFGTVGGSNTLINVGADGTIVKNSYVHGIFVAGDTTSYTEKFVRNCQVINHGPSTVGYGIYCDFVPGMIIENNVVQTSNGNDAIEIGHNGAKCHGNDLLDGPLQFPFGSNSIITNNIIRANTIQNDANTANNVIIIGNQILAAAPTSGFAGISVTGAAPIIKGNYVKVSAQSGIRTYQGDGGVIEGNIVDGTNPSTGGTNGIYSNTSNRVKITGNDISNFATAIEHTHDNNMISENEVNNCTTGVDFSDSSSSGHVMTGSVVVNNNLVGATTPINLHNQTNNYTVKNNPGLNPDRLYAVGNVTTTQTLDRLNGEIQTMTMTGNVTFTFNSGLKDDLLILKIIQDGTGSRLATWPANFKKAGGALTLTTAAGATDIITMRYDGSNWIEVSRALNVS